jgi:hypothetical protein
MSRNLRAQLMTLTEADLFEGGDAGVKYTLRAIDSNIAKELQKQTESGVDRLLAFLNLCLVSWDGVIVDDQPAPCTAEFWPLLDTEVTDALVAKLWTMRAEREATRAKSFRDATAVR